VDDKHADIRLTPAPECEGEEEQGREAAFTWGLLAPGGRRAGRAGGLHTGALASHAAPGLCSARTPRLAAWP